MLQKIFVIFVLGLVTIVSSAEKRYFLQDLNDALNEVPKKFNHMMSIAAVYEAENAQWPSKEYFESRGISFGSTFWKYDMEVKGAGTNEKGHFVAGTFTIKATVREGNTIQLKGQGVNIQAGNYVSINDNGVTVTNCRWPFRSALAAFCKNAKVVK